MCLCRQFYNLSDGRYPSYSVSCLSLFLLLLHSHLSRRFSFVCCCGCGCCFCYCCCCYFIVALSNRFNKFYCIAFKCAHFVWSKQNCAEKKENFWRNSYHQYIESLRITSLNREFENEPTLRVHFDYFNYKLPDLVSRTLRINWHWKSIQMALYTILSWKSEQTDRIAIAIICTHRNQKWIWRTKINSIKISHGKLTT